MDALLEILISLSDGRSDRSKIHLLLHRSGRWWMLVAMSCPFLCWMESILWRNNEGFGRIVDEWQVHAQIYAGDSAGGEYMMQCESDKGVAYFLLMIEMIGRVWYFVLSLCTFTMPAERSYVDPMTTIAMHLKMHFSFLIASTQMAQHHSNSKPRKVGVNSSIACHCPSIIAHCIVIRHEGLPKLLLRR